MRAGSTGLGKQQLSFNIVFGHDVSEGMPPTYPRKQPGIILMHCKTYDPVIWKLWIAIERSDLLPILRVILNIKTLSCLIRWLFQGKKSNNEAN